MKGKFLTTFLILDVTIYDVDSAALQDSVTQTQQAAYDLEVLVV